MSIDKVKLQQQEVVDNEIVNTDINPVTSTTSVFDESTGLSMQDTLDRVWNAINSKLSRYVNSVNNKTGVVVINANDIGLGKVDNVSFNDIKEWVIDYFKKSMAKFKLHIYDSLQDVINIVATNNEDYANTTFYASRGLNGVINDYRSYIGYFEWDNTTSTLTYVARAINTVGLVDASLIYNETIGDKNYEGGKLGVLIHPDETALYVEENDDRSQCGLRIDPSKLTHKMIVSECLYGNDAMLSSDLSNKGDPVIIYVDDHEIISPNGHYLNKDWSEKLELFGLIKTSFIPFYTRNSSGVYVPNGTSTLDLMGRQPAIGVVTKVIDDENPSYEVRFYTIKTFTNGFGLSYYDNHQTSDPAVDKQLGLDLTHNDKMGNMSGIQAKGKGPNITDPSSSTLDRRTGFTPYNAMLPCGWTGTDGRITNSGLIITTDDSICRYPIHLFNPASRDSRNPSIDTYVNSDNITCYLGSKCVDNWSPFAVNEYGIDEEGNGEMIPDGPDYGYPDTTAYLSINLNKLVRDTAFTLTTEEPSDWSTAYKFDYYTREQISDTINDYVYHLVTGATAPAWEPDTYYSRLSTITVNNEEVKNMPRYHFTNLSGLRLTHRSLGRAGVHDYTKYSTLQRDELEAIGIFDGKNSIGEELHFYPFNNFSGGLSVNVGNYLEICPVETGTGETYDDSGKVQVRIGPGLTDDYSFSEVNLTEYGINNPPEDFYKHPERYRKLSNNDEIIPLGKGYHLLTDEPYNWETTYVNYYAKNNGRYIPLSSIYRDTPPFEPNTFYAYGPESWLDIYTSIAMTHLYKAVLVVTRSNRFKVDCDNKTTTLDENNQIKAITVLEEYAAGKNFVKNQLFTNNTSTAVYMAVRDFEATIFEDDIRQGKIFVIKEA